MLHWPLTFWDIKNHYPLFPLSPSIKKHWHQRKIFYHHEIINFLWPITFEWLFSMGLWTANFVITIIPTELSNIGCFFSMWRWYVRIETTVTKPSAVELPGTGKLLWDVFPFPTAIIAHVIHNAIVLSTELLFKYNSRYKLSRRCYLTQWIKQVKKKVFWRKQTHGGMEPSKTNQSRSTILPTRSPHLVPLANYAHTKLSTWHTLNYSRPLNLHNYMSTSLFG